MRTKLFGRRRPTLTVSMEPCPEPTYRVPRTGRVQPVRAGTAARTGHAAARWAEAVRHLVPGGADMTASELEHAAVLLLSPRR